MIKNLYFFTWDEEYLLDQELYRRVSNFTQKFGNGSVSFFHVENWDEWKAKQSIYGWGLFSTKTLTVIDGLPTWTDRFGFTISQVENFIDEFLKKNEKFLLKIYLFLQTPNLIKDLDCINS